LKTADLTRTDKTCGLGLISLWPRIGDFRQQISERVDKAHDTFGLELQQETAEDHEETIMLARSDRIDVADFVENSKVAWRQTDRKSVLGVQIKVKRDRPELRRLWHRREHKIGSQARLNKAGQQSDGVQSCAVAPGSCHRSEKHQAIHVEFGETLVRVGDQSGEIAGGIVGGISEY
jgi:hypothetical protein